MTTSADHGVPPPPTRRSESDLPTGAVEVVGRAVSAGSQGGASGATPARLAAAMSAMIGTTEWSLELWDGRTVPATGRQRFRIALRSPEGLDRLLGALPERAFGRAYAAGLIDIDPLEEFLDTVSTSTVAAKAVAVPRLIRAAVGLGARPRFGPLPEGEARLRGPRHSRRRDEAAVRHHYDLPVEFYALWLDTSLTYSCASFAEPSDTIDTAQRAKLDLVCRKLRLQPGERLLDIGCGWGSLPIHAATHYGVSVVGVTLSPAQAAHARRRVAELGLARQVEIRLADYRDDLGVAVDAVSSIGMIEHVGHANIGRFTDAVAGALRPGGRALIHGITARRGGAIERGSFTDAFIFPDGELEDVGVLASTLERSGLEVRDVENLREHYALTLRSWRDRLEDRWAEAEAIVGPVRMRLWKLYLTGSEIGFRRGRVSVNQFLTVKPGPRGESELPLTRADWYAGGRPVGAQDRGRTCTA